MCNVRSVADGEARPQTSGLLLLGLASATAIAQHTQHEERSCHAEADRTLVAGYAPAAPIETMTLPRLCLPST